MLIAETIARCLSLAGIPAVAQCRFVFGERTGSRTARVAEQHAPLRIRTPHAVVRIWHAACSAVRFRQIGKSAKRPYRHCDYTGDHARAAPRCAVGPGRARLRPAVRGLRGNAPQSGGATQRRRVAPQRCMRRLCRPRPAARRPAWPNRTARTDRASNPRCTASTHIEPAYPPDETITLT